MRGISKDSEYTAYADRDTFLTQSPPLGALDTDTPGAFTTRLTYHKDEPEFEISANAVAVLTRASQEEKLILFVPQSESDELRKVLTDAIALLLPSNRPVEIVSSKDALADLQVTLKNKRVHFAFHSETITKHGLTDFPYPIPASAHELAKVLHRFTHFMWHLKRVAITPPQLPPSPIEKKIILQFLHVTETVPGQPGSYASVGGDLVKDGVLDIIASETTFYAVHLINESQTALYPYLFYFSLSDLSISEFPISSNTHYSLRSLLPICDLTYSALCFCPSRRQTVPSSCTTKLPRNRSRLSGLGTPHVLPRRPRSKK